MSIYKHGNWKFDEEVAPVFDEHVRKSISSYDRIQESVVHMAGFFCPEKATVVDLGSATGETLQRLYEQQSHKKWRLIGVDESREMMTSAMSKVNGNTQYEWVANRIQDFEFPLKTDLVISVLTMQFIEPDDREAVLRKAYQSLKKGGALILVEKVYAESGQIQDIFNQIYQDEKQDSGFTTEEIRRKEQSLRSVMTPMTRKENEELLRTVGFSQQEAFFRHFHFMGWLAIK